MHRADLPTIARVEVDGTSLRLVEDTVATDSEGAVELIRGWHTPAGRRVTTVVFRRSCEEAVTNLLFDAAVRPLAESEAPKAEFALVARATAAVTPVADPAAVWIDGASVDGLAATWQDYHAAAVTWAGATIAVVSESREPPHLQLR